MLWTCVASMVPSTSLHRRRNASNAARSLAAARRSFVIAGFADRPVQCSVGIRRTAAGKFTGYECLKCRGHGSRQSALRRAWPRSLASTYTMSPVPASPQRCPACGRASPNHPHLSPPRPHREKLQLPLGNTFALRSFTISSAPPNGAITSTTQQAIARFPVLRAQPRSARREPLLDLWPYFLNALLDPVGQQDRCACRKTLVRLQAVHRARHGQVLNRRIVGESEVCAIEVEFEDPSIGNGRPICILIFYSVSVAVNRIHVPGIDRGDRQEQGPLRLVYVSRTISPAWQLRRNRM